MKSFLVIVLTLLGAAALRADEASRAQAVAIAESTARTLNYDVPGDWKFVAVSEPEWERLTKQYRSLSETAFSINQWRTTYLREKYVLAAKPSRLRATLAHEFGHVICGCNDERRANYAAQEILH